MRIMLGLTSQQQGLFILRHLKDRQQDSNYLQYILCFHYFHLQCYITHFDLGPFQDSLKFDMPYLFHAFEPGVSWSYF